MKKMVTMEFVFFGKRSSRYIIHKSELLQTAFARILLKKDPEDKRSTIR